MNAAAIIEKARADGLELWADGDRLRLKGTPDTVAKWTPLLAAHKTALIELLVVTAIHAIPATDEQTEPVTIANLRNNHATAQQAHDSDTAHLHWMTGFSLALAPLSESKATDELTRLVRFCGDAYHFTEAEHTEARQIALNDPADALICFRAMSERIKT